MLLRKVLWIGLSAFAMWGGRKVAARVFRIVAGEEPPARK
jgi:hypothetical protein